MWSVKDRVREGRKARFVRCADGALWYATEDGFEFPVPLEETAGASFMSEDKAMFFMRWINRHARMIEAERAAQGSVAS